MTYAISHWYESWHIIVCIGGLACSALYYLVDGLWWFPSDGGRFEAEERGRERIMESFDREHSDR